MRCIVVLMDREIAFIPPFRALFAWRRTSGGNGAGGVARSVVLLVALAVLMAPTILAQPHEFAVSLGSLNSGNRNATDGLLEIGAGTALQANYARRLETSDAADLYFDIHVLGSPSREVSTAIPTASRDFASLYVTPGFKVKFRPASRLNPYVVGGIGLAFFEQSRLDIAGQPNTAPRMLRRGVFTYGGGADLRTASWLALRGEARGFLSGAPALDASQSAGMYHAWVVSGGLVFRIGR